MQSTRRQRTQRFTRSMVDRVFGGVCGGVGSYLGINSWWVRLAFLGLIAFTLGAGLLLYLVLWLAMPEQTLADLYDSPNISRRINPETLVLFGGGVIIVGITVMSLNVGLFDNTNAEAILPFVIILLGLTLLAQQLGRTS
jgi:phage shock protein PspC (stress-responsive transcriptional regulator)